MRFFLPVKIQSPPFALLWLTTVHLSPSACPLVSTSPISSTVHIQATSTHHLLSVLHLQYPSCLLILPALHHLWYTRVHESRLNQALYRRATTPPGREWMHALWHYVAACALHQWPYLYGGFKVQDPDVPFQSLLHALVFVLGQTWNDWVHQFLLR